MTAAAGREKTKWVEANPCPCCGRKGGWCTRSADGEVVKCRRVESTHPVKHKDGSLAWLHPAGAAAGPLDAKALASLQRPRLSRAELADLAKRLRADLVPSRLARFAARMGLSVRALEAYGVGFYAKARAFSFPMVGGDKGLVGFRLRAEDPQAPQHEKAKCIRGSRTGLFLPSNFDAMAAPVPDGVAAWCDLKDDRPLVVLTPEGPTDCAAAMDLGFVAVGRPACNGGAVPLAELLHAGPPRDVVVVADRDATKYLPPDGTPFWPGLEGALRLAEDLYPVVVKHHKAVLRFLLPPEGTKDLRDWLKSGVGPAEFAARVREAPLVSDFWLRLAGRRLAQKKQQERRPPAA